MITFTDQKAKNLIDTARNLHFISELPASLTFFTVKANIQVSNIFLKIYYEIVNVYRLKTNLMDFLIHKCLYFSSILGYQDPNYFGCEIIFFFKNSYLWLFSGEFSTPLSLIVWITYWITTLCLKYRQIFKLIQVQLGILEESTILTLDKDPANCFALSNTNFLSSYQDEDNAMELKSKKNFIFSSLYHLSKHQLEVFHEYNYGNFTIGFICFVKSFSVIFV